MASARWLMLRADRHSWTVVSDLAVGTGVPLCAENQWVMWHLTNCYFPHSALAFSMELSALIDGSIPVANLCSRWETYSPWAYV